MKALRAGIVGVLASTWLGVASAESPSLDAPSLERSARVDRVVARFSAPEIGGVGSPRFVFERELGFEARLEALADPTFKPSEERPYRDVHLRAALERHVAETILESLEVVPSPKPNEVRERVLLTRLVMTERVGGGQALSAAAAAEGLEPREVLRIVERQARASLYLDRMVAPMLRPSEAELRVLHQSGRTPFSRDAYEVIEEALRRWVVSRRLREAVTSYYEGARARIALSIVPAP